MSESESHDFGFLFLAVLAMILLYIYVGHYFEHKHFKCLHETGIGILIGFGVGFIVAFIDKDYYDENIGQFNSQFFFYYLLPPIIFAGGYNLKKRRFFQNIFYINLFGLLSTLLSFGVTVGLTFFISEQGYITRYGNFDEVIKLSTQEILLFSATICATDSVAALAMIKPDKYPKLFSVLFGEGMVNDAIAIILFQAIQNLFGGHGGHAKQFHWYTVLELMGNFLLVAVSSLAIGAFWGLFCTFLLKKSQFLTHNSSVESGIIILFGLCSYVSCELLEMSGVISILVCGIVMAHFNFYNISPSGQVSAGVMIQTLSTLSESFIYIYLGLICWQYYKKGQTYAWSWTFFAFQLLITIIARVISISIPSLIIRKLRGEDKWRLNRYELAIITFAGIIRGSVAFALITKLNIEGVGMQIIKSSILFIVIVTTVVLGTTMPFFIKYNLDKISQKSSKYHADHPTVRDSLDEKKKNSPADNQNHGHQQGGIQSIQQSQEQEQVDNKKIKKTNFIKQLDEKYLKPFFIFEYDKRKDQIIQMKEFLKQNSEKFDGGKAYLISYIYNLKHQIKDNQISTEEVLQKLQQKEKEELNTQESVIHSSPEDSIKVFELSNKSGQISSNSNDTNQTIIDLPSNIEKKQKNNSINNSEKNTNV